MIIKHLKNHQQFRMNNYNQTWTERYRPKNFSSLKGQDLAISKIKDFILNFDNPKRKKNALILHGPPGIGKTTIAHISALELKSEIYELNASDFRDKKKLEETLKPALEQQSLFSFTKKKMILVDEVDGISGYEDRGGISELIDLIQNTKYPIFITANDIWDKKFSSLRSKCEIVQMKELDYKTIKDILIDILKKEGLFVEYNTLTSISIKAKGDVRAAINDIQTFSRSKSTSPPSIIDERNKEMDIFNALKRIFKEKPSEDLLSVYDSVNMPLDEIMLWIEENIPKEYQHPDEIYKAYDYVSKADLFKGRIYKQQYWRFLVYENIFLSYAISSSKNNHTPKVGFTSYKRPTRILSIWMNNQKNAKKKTIASKYASHVHIGEKRAMFEFPVIEKIINSNTQIKKDLKLSDEEIEYLESKIA